MKLNTLYTLLYVFAFVKDSEQKLRWKISDQFSGEATILDNTFFGLCCVGVGLLILNIIFGILLARDKFYGDPRDLSSYNRSLKNSVMKKDKSLLKENVDCICKDIAGSFLQTKTFAEKNIGTNDEDKKALEDTNLNTRIIRTSRANKLPCFNILKGLFEMLHMSCVRDLYNFKIFMGPCPLPPEVETFWKFIVKQKVSVVVCLEITGERKKINPFFQTSSLTVVKFEKYCVALTGKRFRPLCSIYEFEISMNEKLAQQLVIITANRTFNVWPSSVNFEMFQRKHLNFVAFVSSMRERMMETYEHRTNSGMIVLDIGDALKAPGFVTVFIARQLLLQYGCVNIHFLFKYIRKHVFGAFTWSPNGILQVSTVLTLIGNFAKHYVPEEHTPFWVTKTSTRAEHKFFQDFQISPETMDDVTRATQHYRIKKGSKWKDETEKDQAQPDNFLKTVRGPFQRGLEPKTMEGDVPSLKTMQGKEYVLKRCSVVGASTTAKGESVASSAKGVVVLKENSQY